VAVDDVAKHGEVWKESAFGRDQADRATGLHDGAWGWFVESGDDVGHLPGSGRMGDHHGSLLAYVDAELPRYAWQPFEQQSVHSGLAPPQSVRMFTLGGQPGLCSRSARRSVSAG
jgi:hypothetical protein